LEGETPSSRLFQRLFRAGFVAPGLLPNTCFTINRRVARFTGYTREVSVNPINGRKRA
jgi:hypothetical protein